ncbi:hypothetical protein SAMN05444143_103113 [Flavobacterium succinicans]|uniref:HEAT repeat domain-containing protein n=1 Tax=Flavobacterium succinicans TaxID=29536 RepID=A0A1I4UD23_9FLAO|nr:hypothetical protein SAMN05444143_103113 [Flavobacterium succinicans]
MGAFLFYIKNFAIPILVIVILFVSILLLTKRFYNQWLYRLKKKYRVIIQQFLIEIVIHDYDKQELKAKLKDFRKAIPFKRNWCKIIVINEMIRLKKNIKGDKTTIISLLYKSLNLNKYSSKLIHDFRPYKKCIGFYHFQMMKYTKGKHQILPFLNSENDLIQSNATISFIALIDLNQEQLSHVPDKISKLNQIKIMDIFFEIKKDYPKNLDFFLEADKSSLIELGLKIVTYFNNRNASKRIIQLLNYPVESTRIEALIAASKLYLQEAEEPILNKINIYSKKAQIKCYWCLAEIGSHSTTTYIKSSFKHINDPEIQLAAMYCILKIDPILAQNMASCNNEYSKMLQHVKSLWM